MITRYTRSFFPAVLMAILLFVTARVAAANIVVENKAIRFEFDAATGAILSFYDLKGTYEFLDSRSTRGASLWELETEGPAGPEKINMMAAGAFHFSKPDTRTLVLEWSNFAGARNGALKVTVTIKLEDGKPLSAWNISLSGITGTPPGSIVFPCIGGLKDMQHESLAVPVWMGELIKDPRGALAAAKDNSRSYAWRYPGPLSLQMLALYNAGNRGFYAACNDAQSYAKEFSFSLDSLRNLAYAMSNHPSQEAAGASYQLPYDAIIGTFKGDWITAAEIYREWGTQQAWCRDSRFRNKADSSWAAQTALWVWNRGKSGNVLTPAVELKKRLALPVNVLWHWWHGCLYDDGFPEYFPPREGDESFRAAVSKARQEGVRAIVYMNAFQWGTSTESFEKEQAINWAVKSREGKTAAHVFNIFTNHSLTPMCMATTFWKDKYAGLAGRAINEYGTGGVYMDQTCLNYLCYDKGHGHSAGGGNYWVRNFGKLTSQIRTGDRVKDQTVLAGEGCGESWLPYIDAFLTLQVSKERYAGVGGAATIPLFQAVYHPYGITFGSYSSLVSPPYDELWPRENAPESQEQPLAPEFNEQFLVEQARSFAWGQQPTIANYHESLASERKEEIDYLVKLAKTRHKGLKYLLHGEFMRPPHTPIPEKSISISRLSIYAGQRDRVRSFQEKVPLLYTSAWKAGDGTLGIAIASISNQAIPVHFSFPAADYGLPLSGKIYITDAGQRTLLGSYKGGRVNIARNIPPRGICIIETAH